MANIQSQIKRNKTNEKKRLFNQSYRSSMRTAIKAVEQAVVAKDKDGANKALTVALSKIDKAVSKGIVTKNHAARKKSALTVHVNSIA